MLLANQTNLYARQSQASSGRTDSRWQPCTSQDIMRYVYINIMFGIHSMPDLNLYWSSDLTYRVPAVADVMGKSRYMKINQYLHAADSSQQIAAGNDGYDPLFKVRPILDTVRATCKDRNKPSAEISIDEAMVGFNGRLHWKQYIPSKPTKYGIKIWCAAEAKTGYLLNFAVYTGKQGGVEHGLGHHVVMNVGVDYLNIYRIFYFDNFFSSIKLAEDLLAQNTYCCGTIRKNRIGWPFKNSNTKKGETRMMQRGNLLATSWHDKREVNILSTNSNPSSTTVTRTSSQGRINVDIPTPVAKYNENMGGVDLADQYRSYYQVGRASRKWWRYLFWFLVQTAMVNSYLVIKSSGAPTLKRSPLSHHLLFRMKVLENLLARASGSITRSVSESPSTRSITASKENHKCVRIPGCKKRCYQCAAEKKKTTSNRTPETVYGCTTCNVHLCEGPCFAKFHKYI